MICRQNYLYSAGFKRFNAFKPFQRENGAHVAAAYLKRHIGACAFLR